MKPRRQSQASLVLLALAAPIIPPTTLAASSSFSTSSTSTPPIRFWIDECGYAPGETTILRELLAAGTAAAPWWRSGRHSPHLLLTLAGESTSSAALAPKGFWSPAAWEVYFAPRSACARAWPSLTPGKVVTCVPGLGAALAAKPALAAALSGAFGEGEGGGLWPPAYPLPDRLWDWLAEGSRDLSRLWAVKSRRHRGVGVTVAPFPAAAAVAAAGGAPWKTAAGAPPPPAVAQAFITPQATAAGGRPFYVRIWAVVAGGGGGAGSGSFTHPPPRVYLAPGGLAIFGAPPPRNGSASSSASSSIVNMWLIRPADAVVWGWGGVVGEAERVGGEGAGVRLEGGIRTALASALVAASPSLVAAAGAAGVPVPGGALLELIGADFVVRAEEGGAWGEPALVEVNALPSLARMEKGKGRWLRSFRGLLSSAAAAENAFDGAKEGVVAAYARLLAGVAAAGAGAGAAPPPSQPSTACAAAAASLSPAASATLPGLVAEAALAREAGFLPLAGEVVAARAAAGAWAAGQQQQQQQQQRPRLRARLLRGRAGRALAALLSPWPHALVTAGRLARWGGLAGGPPPPARGLSAEGVALEAALAAC